MQSTNPLKRGNGMDDPIAHRAAFVQGLRDMADLFEAAPDLPIIDRPYVRMLCVMPCQPGAAIDQATAVRASIGSHSVTAAEACYIIRRAFGPISLEYAFDPKTVSRQVAETKSVMVWQLDPALQPEEGGAA